MRVIVTRPEGEAAAWVDALRLRGFDAIALPLIRIEPLASRTALESAWAGLGNYQAAMFVSGNAVRHFFAAAPQGVKWPEATSAWATGPGTKQALLQAGVAGALIEAPGEEAGQFDSEALWSRVAPAAEAGDRVLVVRGEAEGRAAGREWLADEMRSKGLRVDIVASYVRRLPQWPHAGAVPDGVWLFSSSQAVANLRMLQPGADWSGARAVATHARIAQAARDAGFGVVCESRPAIDAVALTLESFR